ncbi:MAG: HEAT repeat domain-containing protein [bacterium]|nr:HEAT repeat domain-containing protein [bacterium]
MTTTRIVVAALAALSCSAISAQAEAEAATSAVERFAAARLAESEGRPEAAASELRAVMAHGREPQAKRASQLLTALLARQGRANAAATNTAAARPAPQDPSGGGSPRPDPIQRLILTLDSGASSSPEVKSAVAQLRELDALVVPDLIAALPTLGPFGLNNVLVLLSRRSDPRVADALGQLLAKADPAVVSAIHKRLEGMPRSLAVPLARQLATLDVDVRARASALEVLLGEEREASLARRVATELAQDKSIAARSAVLPLLDGKNQEWVRQILDRLRRDESPSVRARATFAWIGLHPDMTEDEALSLLADIDERELARRVLWLSVKRPRWIRVAAIGARATIAIGNYRDLDDYLDDFEWVAQPAVAAEVLLAMPRNYDGLSSHIAVTIKLLARAGWVLPAEMDRPFCDLSERVSSNWNYFVQLLPDDGEERALALWRERPRARAGLVEAALLYERRPWHRLAAESLIANGGQRNGVTNLLNIDWSGASSEALELLAKFTEKHAADAVRGNYSGAMWQLYSSLSSPPPALILPLIEAGDQRAWIEFVGRDPRGALDWMRAGNSIEDGLERCVDVLPRHGAAEDLPLALRALTTVSLEHNSRRAQQLRVWLTRTCPGDLRILALADPANRKEPDSARVCDMVVRDAVSRVRMADFGAIYARFSILSDYGEELVRALRGQIEPEHAGALVRAIDTERQRELARYTAVEHSHSYDRYLLADLLEFVAMTGSPAGRSAAQRVLIQDDLPESVAAAAARAVVQLTVSDRLGTLKELLGSDRVAVVNAALAAEDIGGKELQKHVTSAVLRLADRLNGIATLMRSLSPTPRVELAQRVLDDAKLRQFSSGVVRSAIDVLAEQRSATYVPFFANALVHPARDVRRLAVIELGNTFDKRAVPPLLEMLKDEDPGNRVKAKECLDQIASYLEELEKWEKRFKDK